MMMMMMMMMIMIIMMMEEIDENLINGMWRKLDIYKGGGNESEGEE